MHSISDLHYCVDSNSCTGWTPRRVSKARAIALEASSESLAAHDCVLDRMIGLVFLTWHAAQLESCTAACFHASC
eukprot:3142984-Amphidinium_carterae.2